MFEKLPHLPLGKFLFPRIVVNRSFWIRRIFHFFVYNVNFKIAHLQDFQFERIWLLLWISLATSSGVSDDCSGNLLEPSTAKTLVQRGWKNIVITDLNLSHMGILEQRSILRRRRRSIFCHGWTRAVLLAAFIDLPGFSIRKNLIVLPLLRGVGKILLYRMLIF